MSDYSTWSGGRHGLPSDSGVAVGPGGAGAGPLGFVATRNTPLELALGDIGFVAADYPAPRGSVAWVGRAESPYGPARTRLGEDGISWGHFGVPAAALEAGAAECRRVGVDPADEAAVLALMATRAAERHAARQLAEQERLAALSLSRQEEERAKVADGAARRRALIRSLLIREADGDPAAHRWLRGDPRGSGYGPGPQATEEEIAEAMASFGGVVPSDDDGRPACKDAYERACWGFISRLAAEFPDGVVWPDGAPYRVDARGYTDSSLGRCLSGSDVALYATPAAALERAKLGKWKGAWEWAQAVAGAHRTMRFSADISGRAARVLALR